MRKLYRELKRKYKKGSFELGWLNSSQHNTNGSSYGEFDNKKDKWIATVNLCKPDETGEHKYKTYKTFKKESKSHYKVALWLKAMRLQYGLK